MSSKEFKVDKPSVCPRCGSEFINYGAIEIEDGNENVYFPVTCYDCEFDFKERYIMKFVVSEGWGDAAYDKDNT